MRPPLLITFACLVLLAFALLCANCSSSKWKCATIIEKNGKAAFETTMLGEAPLDEAPKYGWLPGRVFLFRETQDLSSLNPQLPSGTSGKAGEVYRIDAQNKLQKIAEFDLNSSNTDLLNKYGERCEPSSQK